MGFGKSLKKAFKKVVKIADPAGIVGGGKEEKAQEVAAPVQEAPAPAAQVVEAPKNDNQENDEADTEAAKKAAKAKGKKNLSVARSQGTGLNV